jgi:hypothetical protein
VLDDLSSPTYKHPELSENRSKGLTYGLHLQILSEKTISRVHTSIVSNN